MTEPADEPIQLKGAQRDIRDAFFAHESGLFTLPCVPGAGKSTVAYRLAPEDILRRFVAGDPTPEQGIAIISFNRDEAAEILPKVCDQLRTIVEHDLCPVASEVSEAEVEFLIQRLQQAPFIGTIDSFLRGVLEEFVHDIGFDEMPSVGNEALLARVHAECYEQLKTDPEYSAKLEALESAYPDGEYDDNPAEMLESALTYCRDRQLSTAEFQGKLEQTQDSVYSDGKPEEFTDIVTTVERVVGDDSIGNTVREEVKPEERDALLNADQKLYDAWTDRIEEFHNVLSAYRKVYREITREYGIISHTDVAYLVTSYFDGTLAECDDVDIDVSRRRRVLQRYHGRLQTLIIDEAQDVSEIQHAALSHLVHSDMRVFACGDTLQSIYVWRHADPTLFQSAATTGEYLGIDWNTHVNETATTSYRCVPDIAAAVNEISKPMFDDASRGNLGTLNATYSALEAARNPSDDTSVHITAFSSNYTPGTEQWANPEDENGEADMLATHLSKGLADGTFTDADGESLGITVLFRRSARMSDYEEAFDNAGLRVKTAGENLFKSNVVETAIAVCDWLVSPESPTHLQQLTIESHLGLSSLHADFEKNGWDIDAILESDAPNELQQRTLTDLKHLRDRRDTFELLPASAYLEEIIDQLALRADSNELFPETEPQQRIANLDALVDLIAQWEGDEHYGPAELTELVAPFRGDTNKGPDQPSTSTSEHDVLFKSVHRVKGDEDDIVVIADPGGNASWMGPHNTRLITQGPIAGLAPPTDVEIPTEIDIPPFESGLYNPQSDVKRGIGLRWASAQWRDSVSETAASDALIGPERLQDVMRDERAELWRVLYVALTRARDHLLIPLPQRLPNNGYRDRWIETLRDGVSYDGDMVSYTLSTGIGEISVGVNDVELSAKWTGGQQSTPEADVAISPPHRDDLDPWVPRFLNPSTMYPLTEDPEEHALNHLLGNAIHTEANEISDDLPLQFDTLGPEEIGTAIHDILTQIVSQGISEGELKKRGISVTRTFDEVVDEIAPQISNEERDALWDFFCDVVDDFVVSDLWRQIQQAEFVHVEQPVDGLVSSDSDEVEVHGEADFVLRLPSGEQFVTDIKIALTEPTEETQRRYDLQVSSYAYLFEQYTDSMSVHPTIETFGMRRNTVTPSWPPQIIERRISRLLK